MKRVSVLLPAIVLFGAHAGGLRGQDLPSPPRGTPSPIVAFLSSAVLPGAGQWMQGEDRWFAYAVTELWSWLHHFDRKSRAASQRRDYRDLAWVVARSTGRRPRMDGDFDYYEAMADFVRSGTYDLDPNAEGIQPETDPSTFNGSIWRLAVEIFLPPGQDRGDPGSEAYADAIEYYMTHSYHAEFLWSWEGELLSHSKYRRLLRSSDESFRRATTLLGVVVANHLLSAVDAFISARLGLEEREMELRSGFSLSPSNRWAIEFHVDW